MNIDTTTKVLLVLIAIGLFLNAVAPFVQPMPVQAQAPGIVAAMNRETARAIDEIRRDLQSIQRGTCTNSTIC